MPYLDLPFGKLHWREDGDPAGAPIVFVNSLGTNLHLWDPVVAALPPGLRILRYDTRGHGDSDAPPPPYSMGALIRDLEALMDARAISGAVVVGLSIGGMIAQGLAIKRLDLVRGLVLSNTAAKISTPALWQDRIDTIQAKGLEAIADPVMTRWFSKRFRDAGQQAPWCDMLIQTPQDGYIGCCQAIAGTDFYTPTSGLRLPTLGIAGSEDGSTPPDLVRETVDLIPGSTFKLMRGVGHLPCVEDPGGYVAALMEFLTCIDHPNVS